MAKKQELEEVNTKTNLPSTEIDYASVAGMGLDNAEADDYAVPFIYIVQKAAKIIDSNDKARPGMLYNSVTGDLYDELLVLPCHFQKEYCEWVPHDDGGGFRGVHAWNSGILDMTTEDDRGNKMLENGNQIVDTRKHYVVCMDPATGEIFPAIIAMTSTQTKKSKRWLSMMGNKTVTVNGGQKVQAPTFAFEYRLTTITETKDNYSWSGWVITPGAQISDTTLFQKAHDLYTAVRDNELKEAAPSQA